MVSAGWFCGPTVQRSPTLISALPPPAGEDALVTEVRQTISDLEDLALRLPLDSFGLPTVGDVDPEVTRRANDLEPKLQRLIEKLLGKDGARVRTPPFERFLHEYATCLPPGDVGICVDVRGSSRHSGGTEGPRGLVDCRHSIIQR